MALKKQKEYKGMNAEYWRINQFTYDDTKDIANVSLWLYGNKEASDSSESENGLYREVIEVEGIKAVEVPEQLQALNLSPRDLLKTLLYTKIKESKIVNKLREPTEQEVIDGTEITEYIDVETNWFADSVDC